MVSQHISMISWVRTKYMWSTVLTKRVFQIRYHAFLHELTCYGSCTLKEGSAGYFWSCIFVFFIAHWNMWNNINHWHKNTQLKLFLTLLSCNYNTTISIKTNRSITWTLPMMSPALTSWKIDYAETTKLGGWLVFSLGLLMFRLVDS